jgi:hypothetical protein
MGLAFVFMVFFQSSQSCGLLLLSFFKNSIAMVFFFLAETSKLWSSSSWFFPTLPKPWSFLPSFSKAPWLWSSSSWLKPQSCGLVLHGFFLNSQNHLLLPSLYPRSHGLLLIEFFQNSQFCYLLLHGFFQSSQSS